jgi:hypothetical protein
MSTADKAERSSVRGQKFISEYCSRWLLEMVMGPRGGRVGQGNQSLVDWVKDVIQSGNCRLHIYMTFGKNFAATWYKDLENSCEKSGVK